TRAHTQPPAPTSPVAGTPPRPVACTSNDDPPFNGPTAPFRPVPSRVSSKREGVNGVNSPLGFAACAANSYAPWSTVPFWIRAPPAMSVAGKPGAPLLPAFTDGEA